MNWTYWALNGEDRYGLLDSNYNATPVSAQKQSSLASIQFALNGGTTTGSAPAAPSNLSATATSSSQVNLSWAASSTSGVTYTVYFGTTSGSTKTVLAGNVAGTNYSATNLNPSTTYYFTVEAMNGAGASAPSNQASATTQAASAPAAPSNLNASANSSSQINLSWTASSTNGVTYTVYSGTSANPTSVLASGLSGTTYAATKAGISSLAEGIRADVYGTPIKVTTIQPGFIRTSLNDKARAPYMAKLEPGVRSMVKASEREVAVGNVPMWPFGVISTAMRLVPMSIWAKLR